MNNNWDENNNMNSEVNEENINSSVQPQPTVSSNDYNNFENSIINKDIAKGKTEEGILYFSEKDGPDNYSYDKEDYYLELK